MAIQLKGIDAHVLVDPLSIAGLAIRVLSGNPAQTFNRDTQEYEPDRALVPLVMLPQVSVVDPDGKNPANPALTGVEWYAGTPLKDGSNRITNDTEGYEVGDGTVAGFPKYALKVKVNIGPDTPREIYAVPIFVDVRTNTEVRTEASVTLYTAYYDALQYKVRLDVPDFVRVDPLRVVADADGAWPVEIPAQLYSGENAVDDANAAYWWKCNDGTGWREFTEDELEMVVLSGRDEAGHWQKALTVDARLFERLSLRCYAASYTGTRPDAPSNEELQAECGVLVRMPDSLTFTQNATAGVRQGSSLATPVKAEVVVSDNRKVFTDKDALFRFEWYGKSFQPGAAEKFIATGRAVTFVPSQFFPAGYGFSYYCKVAQYRQHVALKDGDTYYTDGGKYLIDKEYE